MRVDQAQGTTENSPVGGAPIPLWDECQAEQPPPSRARSRTLPHFSEVGRLTERETKHGTPYLCGEMLGRPVYVFPRDDGSWRVFTPTDLPEVVPPPEAPQTDAEAEPLTEYVHTLDDVVIPDPGEPVRRSVVHQSHRPITKPESKQRRGHENRKGYGAF
jgi:hypothetical protein